MDLMEAIQHRHSVRTFMNTPVTKKTLEALVQAAVLAPSAVNAQPWHFTIVQNKVLLDDISIASKAHMLTVIDEMTAPHAAMRAHLEDPHFHVFYHAPALILISAIEGDFAIEDTALAAENLMLTAYGHGLGTCWIGFAQKWLQTAEGKKSVELGPQYMPIAPIIVGYPQDGASPVSRNAPLIHWID